MDGNNEKNICPDKKIVFLFEATTVTPFKQAVFIKEKEKVQFELFTPAKMFGVPYS